MRLSPCEVHKPRNFDWLTRWEYAHRGLHRKGVPENSLSAARAAILAGLGIECDIQLSKDDQPIVFHDWELDRLTDRTGLVSDIEADKLEKLPLLGTEETPTHLAKFLANIGHQAPVLIEIKSKSQFDVGRSCEQVFAVIATYQGPFAVMSFDPLVGAWFAKNAPDVPRGLVCTDSLDLGFLNAWRSPGVIEMAQPDFLAVDIRNIPNSICSLWRLAGHPLLSWTIRSRELREKSIGLIDAPIAEGEGVL